MGFVDPTELEVSDSCRAYADFGRQLLGGPLEEVSRGFTLSWRHCRNLPRPRNYKRSDDFICVDLKNIFDVFVNPCHSDFIMRETSDGVVVTIEKGTNALVVGRRLQSARCKRVAVYINEVEVARRVCTAAPLLADLASQLQLRCLVTNGVARVFPRPYCELGSNGLTINGRPVDRASGLLSRWRAVWPELDSELNTRCGSFVCGS